MQTAKTVLSAWGVLLSLLAAVNASAQTGVINACIQKNQGTLRLVASLEQCNPSSEQAISWTLADPVGLQDQIDTLNDRIDELEAINTALMNDLACLSTDSDDQDIYFEGCNVHVRNGAGATNTVNGFGNLIVGYDEAFGGILHCSNGLFGDQVSCESAGEIWGRHQKTGSHNVVIGADHSYPQSSGLVAGFRNVINGILGSSVSGGANNIASGRYSSVSGGLLNTASGNQSSVSGGEEGEASGGSDWVAGDLFQDI